MLRYHGGVSSIELLSSHVPEAQLQAPTQLSRIPIKKVLSHSSSSRQIIDARESYGSKAEAPQQRALSITTRAIDGGAKNHPPRPFPEGRHRSKDTQLVTDHHSMHHCCRGNS